jgi:hypothetical protein
MSVISLFGKITNNTKIVYKFPDDVVIGSRTNKEYAFQVGNFMNMLYSNIKKESNCTTNKVVIHNLQVELNKLKNYIDNIEHKQLYQELITYICEIPNADINKAYILFDKSCEIIATIFNKYYFLPNK